MYFQFKEFIMMTIETGETMAEYVKRKLQDPSVKLRQVAKVTGLSLSTVYNIRKGNDSMCSNVQTLRDYFRKAAD